MMYEDESTAPVKVIEDRAWKKDFDKFEPPGVVIARTGVVAGIGLIIIRFTNTPAQGLDYEYR